MGSLSVRPSAGFAQSFEIAASCGVDLGPKRFDLCRTASEYQRFRVATNQSGQVVHHRVGRTKTRDRSGTNWRLVLRALWHRNYRLSYGGQGISLIGTWMTRVATGWLVYRLTHSAFLLGLVSFSGQIPF